jgi:hypothetical protein
MKKKVIVVHFKLQLEGLSNTIKYQHSWFLGQVLKPVPLEYEVIFSQ